MGLGALITAISAAVSSTWSRADVIDDPIMTDFGAISFDFATVFRLDAVTIITGRISITQLLRVDHCEDLLNLYIFSTYFVNGSVFAAAVYAFSFGRITLIGDVAAAAAAAADGRMSAVLSRMAVFEAMFALH